MSKKPTELTNDELIKQEKTMKGLTLTFAGILIVLFGVTLFSMFKKGFSSTVITPVIFLPLLVINLKNWKDLKEEKKARGLLRMMKDQQTRRQG